METVINGTAYSCEKPAAEDTESFVDCFEMGVEEEASTDVVESFELLHQSIPWLQKARVSTDSCKGQLKILQAAIDYIIDLEEQLTEHLSEDLYRVAIRESKAALERTLAATRRPFADVNDASAAGDGFEVDEDADVSGDSEESPAAQQQMQQQTMMLHMQMQPSFLTSGDELHRSS